MRRTILHMSCIPGVGPATIIQLYTTLGGDAIDRVYRMTVDQLQAYGLGHKVAQTLHDGLRDQRYCDNELQAIERVGAQYVTIADDAYPSYLWHIPTPAPVLYYQGGSLEKLAKSVAFIGSRKAGVYARRSVDRLIPDVVAHGYAVISGGAYGADTLAHRAALHHNGVTAAVLGSGLGQPYPERNRRLFHEIQESGGIILSPFPIDTKAQAYHFPMRNRIIAGLSRGVVVLQAAQQSGTHITASYALEAGRDVGAVPGHIDDPLSHGVHDLLKHGASVITSGADVVSMCGESYNTVSASQRAEHHETSEDPIVALCRTPRQFDTLLAETNMPFPDLQQRLMELQLSGKITQDVSGCWCSC